MSRRILFMGTPLFAAPSLIALHGGPDEVVAVCTAVDKPSGRGRRLGESAVKVAARDLGLPILQPRTLRSEESIELLRSCRPDAIVVAAYGKILPPAVLGLPPFGAINVHPSYLPRHRGAAPIQGSILAGDAETGVTIMLLDEGMDTGPILAQRLAPLGPAETAESLTNRLAFLGAELLMHTLPAWFDGSVAPQPQIETIATTTAPIKKDDGILDWSLPAVELERIVRAYYPWPSAQTTVAGTRIKILAARVVEIRDGVPGTVSEGADKLPVVATGSGGLALERVQPAGKREQSGAAWLNGHRASVGAVLPS